MAKQNMAQVGRDVLAMSVEETIAAAQLPPRLVERLQTDADALLRQLDAAAERWTAMMGAPKARTAQEIDTAAMRTHFLYCAALGALNYANVDATRYLGQSTQEIAESIVAKAAARRRGAGARAVRSKYGPTVARAITGHTIR